MRGGEEPQVDTLFVALTRSPITFGVPFFYFFFLFIIGAVIFLIPGLTIFQVFAIEVFVLVPLYGMGYVLTARDPFWISILLTKFNKCTPTMNRKHWKSDSYMP